MITTYKLLCVQNSSQYAKLSYNPVMAYHVCNQRFRLRFFCRNMVKSPHLKINHEPYWASHTVPTIGCNSSTPRCSKTQAASSRWLSAGASSTVASISRSCIQSLEDFVGGWHIFYNLTSHQDGGTDGCVVNGQWQLQGWYHPADIHVLPEPDLKAEHWSPSILFFVLS